MFQYNEIQLKILYLSILKSIEKYSILLKNKNFLIKLEKIGLNKRIK